MIYNKPRKMMNVDRMRHQRDKHNEIRYYKHWMNRRDLVDMPTEVQQFVIDEMREAFRMQVARWNMWQDRKLTPITMHLDYDIDRDLTSFLFEVRRLPRYRQWKDVMARMSADNILTRHEVRAVFGLEPM